MLGWSVSDAGASVLGVRGVIIQRITRRGILLIGGLDNHALHQKKRRASAGFSIKSSKAQRTQLACELEAAFMRLISRTAVLFRFSDASLPIIKSLSSSDTSLPARPSKSSGRIFKAKNSIVTFARFHRLKYPPELPTGRQRIRSRTCVVDPTQALMQGITRLFGRENVLLEGEV